MSLKTKTNGLPPVRLSEKLKEETIKVAALEQENLSEYVRKAVEIRNSKVLENGL